MPCSDADERRNFCGECNQLGQRIVSTIGNMTADRAHRSASTWPIWLLALAWLCANSPQSAGFEIISWIKGASHFSHQTNLVESASLLLSDQEIPRAQLAAATEVPAPVEPLIPAEATIKKIELVVPDWNGSRMPRVEVVHYFSQPIPAWGNLVQDVPLPPPRV